MDTNNETTRILGLDGSVLGSARKVQEGKLTLDESVLHALGYELSWSPDGNFATVKRKEDHGKKLTQWESTFIGEGDEWEPLIQEVARDLFQHPQLAYKEEYACQRLCHILEEHGFQIERNLKGIHPLTQEEWVMDTAFIASMEGLPGGPTIGLMLEYDALPAGHACGHNLIASAGLTAALMLAKQMKEVQGKLMVFGTPGEEDNAGKAHMVEAGHFKDVDIALITHPGDRWATGSDFLATTMATIVYTGVPSHASAAPEKGISALDAAVISYNAIEMQREHLRKDARVHGIISDGGKASNVVPERAEMQWCIRAFDKFYLEKLSDMIQRCAQAGALATGAEVDISWSVFYGAPIKVQKLDQLVIDMAEEMGAAPIKIFDVLGSSDMGNVSFELPTCNLWFSIADLGILPHTREFLEAAGSEEAVKQTILAGKVMAVSAMKLFKDPQLVREIQEEFNQNKQQLLSQS